MALKCEPVNSTSNLCEEHSFHCWTKNIGKGTQFHSQPHKTVWGSQRPKGRFLCTRSKSQEAPSAAAQPPALERNPTTPSAVGNASTRISGWAKQRDANVLTILKTSHSARVKIPLDRGMVFVSVLTGGFLSRPLHSPASRASYRGLPTPWRSGDLSGLHTLSSLVCLSLSLGLTLSGLRCPLSPGLPQSRVQMPDLPTPPSWDPGWVQSPKHPCHVSLDFFFFFVIQAPE